MGSTTFTVYQEGQDLREAFLAAVSQAKYEYGHRGYTGSLAEKDSVVVIKEAGTVTLDQALELSSKLVDEDDPRIWDKWGPAGAIRVKGLDPESKEARWYSTKEDPDGWLFFGWASS